MVKTVNNCEKMYNEVSIQSGQPYLDGFSIAEALNQSGLEKCSGDPQQAQIRRPSPARLALVRISMSIYGCRADVFIFHRLCQVSRVTP